jgi:hypothetical protein
MAVFEGSQGNALFPWQFLKASNFNVSQEGKFSLTL